MKLGTKYFPDWTGEKYGSNLSVSAEGLSISGGKNNPPIATFSGVEYTPSGKWLVIRMSADNIA